METPRMKPDGTITLYFAPYRETTRLIEADTAARIKATLAMLEELGETPTFDIPLRAPRPKNERPWHKHTLPSRRRK